MPRISKDERSCAFSTEFGKFSEYYEKLAHNNWRNKIVDPFVANMPWVLKNASNLDKHWLLHAILVVNEELNKQNEVGHNHNKLLQLHVFLKRVQQSEMTYFTTIETEDKECEDLQKKHDLQCHEEDQKIEEIERKILELRDQIQELNYARDELREKRRTNRQEREKEREDLRKRQKRD